MRGRMPRVMCDNACCTISKQKTERRSVEKKLATIDVLPGQNWSASAALGDAMASVKDGTKIIVLFLDEENRLRWRSANVNYSEAHLMLSQEAARLIREMAGYP